MAGPNRRFALGAITLPFLFLVMSGLAGASTVIVNTTDSGSDSAPLCTLEDAITAINTTSIVGGCAAGSGNDTIEFIVTGRIFIDATLEIVGTETLSIIGPSFGCTGPGPCGIIIDGSGDTQIMKADPSTSITLQNLTFANGYATEGGAIYANGANLEIDNCTFANNTAQGSGPQLSGPVGALYLSGGEGGAIYGNSDGLIDIVNCTFANNAAVSSVPGVTGSVASTDPYGSYGGAIFDFNSTLDLSASTFEGNSAVNGGALSTAADPSIKSTLFANNSGGNCFGANTDLGYNLSDDDSCGFTTGNNTDPLLDPAGLANNGGPAQTIALQADSPAIDLVPVADCSDQDSGPLGTDERLYARPDPANFDACDSGAYEADALAPIVLKSERIQIARSVTSPDTRAGIANDQVNMGLTFTENGDPDCNNDEDALNYGIGVELFAGTCAHIPNNGLEVTLSPFVVHTVNGQSYGTFFESMVPEKISARMVALMKPAGSCQMWTLNLEVSGLDTAALGLGGSNPFALIIYDLVDGYGCFDVTNAIVGNQINPPGRRVRRGVRR